MEAAFVCSISSPSHAGQWCATETPLLPVYAVDLRFGGGQGALRNCCWGTPVLLDRGYPQGYGVMMGYTRPGVELVRLW